MWIRKMTGDQELPHLPPLIIGNSRVEESPPPLKNSGPGALAMCQGETTVYLITIQPNSTQHTMDLTPLALPADGGPTGGGSHIASLGCARLDPMGKDQSFTIMPRPQTWFQEGALMTHIWVREPMNHLYLSS